jgi:hypothetical protein
MQGWIQIFLLGGGGGWGVDEGGGLQPPLLRLCMGRILEQIKVVIIS